MSFNTDDFNQFSTKLCVGIFYVESHSKGHPPQSQPPLFTNQMEMKIEPVSECGNLHYAVKDTSQRSYTIDSSEEIIWNLKLNRLQ